MKPKVRNKDQVIGSRDHQLNFLVEHQILKDIKGRTQKFKKILSVLQDFHPDTQSLTCLDIGCSSGIITSLLGEHFSGVIGMDIDEEAVRYAKEHSSLPQVHLLIGDAMSFPFHDGSIDVIVCNHIYEHVPEASRMMEEIHRVLKEDGFCYFSAGNKYVLMEGHYHLPLLSWLPKPLAHFYLRVTGKGNDYYEKHLSLRGLKRLVKRFRIHDYTLSIIRNPEKFHATDLLGQNNIFHVWIRWLASHLYRWIPTYIWVLTKR